MLQHGEAGTSVAEPVRPSNRGAPMARLVVLVLVGLLIGGARTGHAETTLRMVPQADLKILDPIWTSANITQIHAYLVFDTLFGMDGQQRPQPQMVEAWQRSPD